MQDPQREAARRLRLGRAGWRAVVKRLRCEVRRDNLDVVAAGVAFYGFISLFPALAAGVSLYGLVSDPRNAVAELDTVLAAAPSGVGDLVGAEAARLADQSQSALSFGLVSTVVLALWTANKGMKGMLKALNMAYDQREPRGFLRENTLSLALTFGSVVSAAVLLGLSVAVPIFLEYIGMGGVAGWIVRVARWPLLACWILFSLAVLYRVGPTRPTPNWHWITPGSLLATALWLLASVGFAAYAARFDKFNKTYGALGAVAILLTWLYFSAYSILLGAELNAEAEQQTRETRAPPGDSAEPTLPTPSAREVPN